MYFKLLSYYFFGRSRAYLPLRHALNYFNLILIMKYHSHEGRRIHDVGDILLDKMLSCGAHLTDQYILDVFSQFDGRSKVEELEKAISMLEELIANGHDNICVRSILKSKRKILKNYFVSPTNTPPSSDDEEDFDDPVDGETSQVVDCQRIMTMFDPMTSSNTGFVSDMDDYAGGSFGDGIRTADCCSECNTQRLSGQSFDIGNGRSTDESFQSGIISADCAPDGKARSVSVQTLYENTVSAVSMDNINDKNQVHPIWRSLDTDCFGQIQLCGVDAGCRTDLLLQCPILEKWCALRTLCIFLSILLVGLCASTFSDITSRLVS